MANDGKTYQLAVEPRTVIGKQSRQLRRQELLPGVVYGHNIDPVAVQVNSRELDRVYLHAGGTTLVDLVVGNGEPRKVFIHEVQRDPRTHALRHVDFMVVNLREAMNATIVLTLTGESRS